MEKKKKLRSEEERGLRERLCRALDLAPDCFSGECLVELRGRYAATVRGGGRILLYTPEEIRIRWEDQILNGFFALDYLADAHITDNGSTFTLHLAGNEAFCDAVSGSFRSVIPNDLDAIADSFETDKAGGFLTVDKASGLPVAMGMEFSRTHIIGGVSYPLSFTLTQQLKLSDSSTQDALQ